MKLKTITKLGAAAAVALALTSTASASYIVGVYGFSGTAILNSTSVNTATQVNSWGTQAPGVLNGTYATEGLTSPIFITPNWVFSAPAGPTILGFWTAADATTGFTFDLTSSTVDIQSGGTLKISGSGVVKHANYQDTFATFNLTFQDPGAVSGSTANFTISSSGSSVPDGGATVALLGFSLLGLHGVRRKFAK